MTAAGQSFICAFCGETGRRSDEHVLPQWMRKIFPDIPATFDISAYGWGLNARESAYASSRSEKRTSSKPILHQKIRSVCKRCNEGWMSKLETRAEPIIVNLINAAESNNGVRLTREEASDLALWATKTSFTLELLGAEIDTTYTTPQARLDLMQGRLPPRTLVELCRCSPHDEGIHTSQKYSEADASSPPNPDEEPRRSMTTTMILKGLAIIVRTGDRGGPVPNLKPIQRVPIWPYLPGEYPPLESMTPSRVMEATSNYPDKFHALPFDTNDESAPAGPRLVSKIRRLR